MLTSPEDWMWDSWLADDGERYHLFFLAAPRSLSNPDLRHRRARIGHAISSDLRSWQRVADALDLGAVGALDTTCTWTGSVVRSEDGRWHLLWTGARWIDTPATADAPAAHGVEQIIRRATCEDEDLLRWTIEPDGAVGPDERWYETFSRQSWPVHAWRDPWVVPDPGGRGWHALITARAARGGADQRGVIGHATSPDLTSWTVGPPLSEPGSGFGQLEVPQVACVQGRWVLVFSCLADQVFGDQRQRHGQDVGMWAVPVPGPLGPFDVAAARPLTGAGLYAGHLVQDRSQRWVLIAFDNATGGFGGTITDPLPVSWDGDRLTVVTG